MNASRSSSVAVPSEQDLQTVAHHLGHQLLTMEPVQAWHWLVEQMAIFAQAQVAAILTSTGEHLRVTALWHQEDLALSLQDLAHNNGFLETLAAQVVSSGEPVHWFAGQSIAHPLYSGSHNALVVPVVVDTRVNLLLVVESLPFHGLTGVHQQFLESLAFYCALRLRTWAQLEQVAQENRLLRAMVNNSNEKILVSDLQGVLRYVSPSFETVFGFDPQQWVGRTAWELIHPDDLATAEIIFRRLTETESPQQLRYRLKHQNGSYRTMDSIAQYLDQGTSAVIVVNSQDVTEQVQAQTSLQEQEARLRAILDGASMGIALIDRSRNILHSNPKLQEMLGYSAEELSQRTFPQITHPEDVGTHRDLSTALGEGRLDHYEIERRYIRKDGSVLPTRVRISRVRDAESSGH